MSVTLEDDFRKLLGIKFQIETLPWGVAAFAAVELIILYPDFYEKSILVWRAFEVYGLDERVKYD